MLPLSAAIKSKRKFYSFITRPIPFVAEIRYVQKSKTEIRLLNIANKDILKSKRNNGIKIS